ncbi:MAG TPA: Mur ligase family protein [Rhabdochlamydiaceae bacterium]|nr:Mur ligase family protein [Rhabdochlamydiaceae bacterium]
MKRISLQEIAPSQNSIAVSGFAIDSRAVQEGNLFFALPGKKVDGHQFLFEAAQKKAKAAIVSKDYQGESFGLELIYVEDVCCALQQLAKVAFSKRQEKVIAITGSVGKTTTKEFLAHLLSAKYRVFKTEGSFNSQLSFPLTLLNMEGEYDILVFEMGMSQPGELTKLVQIAPPDIAVITRIAIAHVAFFSDGIQGIAKAKAEILSHPKTRLAVVSEQAYSFPEIAHAIHCEKQIYSLKSFFPLPFSATHLQENFLAAYTVCRSLGLSDEEILLRAQTLKPFPMRFEILERHGITFVKDCYNANPESMRAALLNLPQAQKRRIGILGSMVELGPYSEISHRQIGELALQCVDELLCLGPDCQPMIELFHKAGKKAALISSLELLKIKMEECIQKGDVVLIKGSKVHQLWKLLED